MEPEKQQENLPEESIDLDFDAINLNRESLDEILKELMGEEELREFTENLSSGRAMASSGHFAQAQKYDRKAKTYEKDSFGICPPAAEHEFIGDMLEILGLSSKILPLKVLDVGCGTGYLTRMLSSIGWDVTGIDSSPGMIQEAQAASPEIRYIHDNASCQNSDFENDPFDLIISKDVVWSLFEPDLTLEHWKRWLKDSGRIVTIWHDEGEDPSCGAGENLVICGEFKRSKFSYNYYGVRCDFAESLLRTGYQDLKFAWMARVNAGQVTRKIDFPYFMLAASRGLNACE